jgi:hypothetical protein
MRHWITYGSCAAHFLRRESPPGPSFMRFAEARPERKIALIVKRREAGTVGLRKQNAAVRRIGPVRRQLGKERGDFLEVARIEAFGEACVDRRQQGAGLGALGLIAPKAGQAGSGAQFPMLRALCVRCFKGAAQPALGIVSIRADDQHLAHEPIQFRLIPSLVGSLDQLKGFI